jgi:M6 family metalloprotease-like protein
MMKTNLLPWCIVVALLLSCAATSQALQPPTAEQIKQYKHEGTWEARQQAALAIGNHKMKPTLAAKANYKLRRLGYEAAGKNVQEIDRILPAPPSAWQGMPTTGNVKMFVLLIEFSEYPHIVADTQSAVHSQIFGQENTSSSNYPYESLNAYYNRSSYGLLNLGGGSTLGWYNAGSRSSVAETDEGRENLIMAAINSFDTAGHDFSQYDNDGDGVIDYFAVVWTGPIGDWSSFWWGYQTAFYVNNNYQIDGKRLSTYSWQWESGSYPNGSFDPNVLIHETGHALGLPDYYDYDDTVGPDGGVGGLDMMDGNWGDHNAFSKFVLDWLTPTVIANGSQQKFLSPSSSAADAFLVMPNATGSPFEEFFIVEHRKRERNDKYIPADGLLIWHVDAALSQNSWGDDYIYNNSYSEHKLLRLMEADGLEEIEQNLSADEGDFYTPSKEFTPATVPNSNAYNGASTNVRVMNIAAVGNDMVCDASVGSAVDSYRLNVSKIGNGTGTVTSIPAGINCGNNECSALFNAEQNVTLTAAAAGGSTFAGWGGACSGSSSTCTVTMDAARSVTAAFNIARHQLSVAKSGTGVGTVTSSPAGISCGAACSAEFAAGQSVTLTAAAASGSTFAGWGGACSGSSSTCTVTMNAAKSATAAFYLESIRRPASWLPAVKLLLKR